MDDGGDAEQTVVGDEWRWVAEGARGAPMMLLSAAWRINIPVARLVGNVGEERALRLVGAIPTRFAPTECDICTDQHACAGSALRCINRNLNIGIECSIWVH